MEDSLQLFPILGGGFRDSDIDSPGGLKKSSSLPLCCGSMAKYSDAVFLICHWATDHK